MDNWGGTRMLSPRSKLHLNLALLNRNVEQELLHECGSPKAIPSLTRPD
jgi:hypothetical protein